MSSDGATIVVSVPQGPAQLLQHAMGSVVYDALRAPLEEALDQKRKCEAATVERKNAAKVLRLAIGKRQFTDVSGSKFGVHLTGAPLLKRPRQPREQKRNSARRQKRQLPPRRAREARAC